MSTSIFDFVLLSKSNIVALETIELSHSSFTKKYRFVRNALTDIIITIGNQTLVYTPVPMEISPSTTSDDLDAGFSIRIGDLGEIIRNEIDRIAVTNRWEEKPLAIYRVYRSDILTNPIVGPVSLECVDWQFDKHGFHFNAQASRLNIVSTGSLYRIERFPMLAGFANDQS